FAFLLKLLTESDRFIIDCMASKQQLSKLWILAVQQLSSYTISPAVCFRIALGLCKHDKMLVMTVLYCFTNRNWITNSTIVVTAAVDLNGGKVKRDRTGGAQHRPSSISLHSIHIFG